MGEGRHCGIRLAFDTLTPQHARANTHTQSRRRGFVAVCWPCCRQPTNLSDRSLTFFSSSLEVKHAKKKKKGGGRVLQELAAMSIAMFRVQLALSLALKIKVSPGVTISFSLSLSRPSIFLSCPPQPIAAATATRLRLNALLVDEAGEKCGQAVSRETFPFL